MHPPAATRRRSATIYRAYLDTEAIDRLGLKPAQPALDAIAAARSHEDLARLMGRPELRAQRAAARGDHARPEGSGPLHGRRSRQSGLGMPDRDYYLKDDAVYSELRDQVPGAHRAAAEARRRYQLGRGGAARSSSSRRRSRQLHWPVAKRRERDLTYNLQHARRARPARAGFRLAAAVDRRRAVAAQPQFVVRELDAVQGLEQLFLERAGRELARRTSVSLPGRAMRTCCRRRSTTRSSISTAARLNGQEQQRDRWKRAVAAVDDELGEAVGELYVQRYFPPSSKRKMLELVENLRASYTRAHPRAAMDDAGDAEAGAGEARGLPPQDRLPRQVARLLRARRSCSGDAFGNVARAAVFEWQRQVKRLGRARPTAASGA